MADGGRRDAVPGTRLRGLIVDWGGVLTLPLEATMGRWAREDGVELAHFQDVMRAWVGLGLGYEVGGSRPGSQHPEGGPASGSPVHALERGEISTAEFEQLLADELATRGSPVLAQGLLRRMLGGLDALVPDMAGLVRRARTAGLRTGLLSNSWGDHYPEQAWEGLFDAVVISGRVGMRKPEAAIYRHAAALLGLDPGRCVMVDDLPHNVRGAVAVGMVGVLHRSYDQTAEELEALFDLALR